MENLKMTSLSLEEKMKYVKQIFEHYCRTGDKHNSCTLTISKFKKLVKDFELSSYLLPKDIDLIFTKVTSAEAKTSGSNKSMDYNMLLQALVLMAEKVKSHKEFKEYEIKSIIEVFLDVHFMPKFSKIVESESNLKKESLFSSPIKKNEVLRDASPIKFNLSKEIKHIIISVSSVLYEIYRKFFRFEITNLSLKLAIHSTINLTNQHSIQKENSIEDMHTLSRSAIVRFCAEFDIYPILISKSQALGLFIKTLESRFDKRNSFTNMIESILTILSSNGYSSMNSYSFGQLFTFPKFLLFFWYLADMNYEINLSFLSQYEKLCLIIERMENSRGFIEIKKDVFISGRKFKSFLLPTEIVTTLQEKVKEQFSKDNLNVANTYNLTHNRLKYGKDFLRRELIQNYESTFFDYISTKYSSLTYSIFMYFTSLYEPLNNSKMRYGLFEKLLKQAQLVGNKTEKSLSKEKTSTKGMTRDKSRDTFQSQKSSVRGRFLKKEDIEKIFYKVCSRKNHTEQNTDLTEKKTYKPAKSITVLSIDMSQFICALEIIAVILYGSDDAQGSVDFLMENNLISVQKSILNAQSKENNILDYYISEQQSNQSFADVVSLLSKALEPYFNYYSNGKPYINFDTLRRLLTDFSIFPNLISIKKIKIYFKKCNTQELSQLSNEDLLAFDSFVHFFCLCSFELPFKDPQPDSVSRVLYLLQRASQSEYLKEVLVKMGTAALLIKKENIDILSNFKVHFPHYFNQEAEVDKRVDFNKIMDIKSG